MFEHLGVLVIIIHNNNTVILNHINCNDCNTTRLFRVIGSVRNYYLLCLLKESLLKGYYKPNLKKMLNPCCYCIHTLLMNTN